MTIRPETPETLRRVRATFGVALAPQTHEVMCEECDELVTGSSYAVMATALVIHRATQHELVAS